MDETFHVKLIKIKDLYYSNYYDNLRLLCLRVSRRALFSHWIINNRKKYGDHLFRFDVGDPMPIKRWGHDAVTP